MVGGGPIRNRAQYINTSYGCDELGLCHRFCSMPQVFCAIFQLTPPALLPSDSLQQLTAPTAHLARTTHLFSPPLSTALAPSSDLLRLALRDGGCPTRLARSLPSAAPPPRAPGRCRRRRRSGERRASRTDESPRLAARARERRAAGARRCSSERRR